MKSLADFFALPWLFFKVKVFLFKEAKRVRCEFPGFVPYEKAFHQAYRFCNPFHICKQFLKQKGEKQIDAYGETPLPVFHQIACECSLQKDDVVIEMGCGRGRGAIFLSHLIGCRVIGIDWVPLFIEKANSIVDNQLPASFRCEAMQEADLSEATVIYLYGTCLEDREIDLLARRFESLPSSVKIVTVSYPLSDYSPHFKTLKQFIASFPWGEAEIYVNITTSAS